MSDQSAAIYKEMTYDSGDIGYGERPGIIVVDFQTGFTDPQYPLGGAALTLAADIAVRLLSPGPELKLGVLTALIGSPFFVYLLISMRKTGQ